MFCFKPTRRRKSAYLLSAILVCVVVYGSLFVLLPPTGRDTNVQILSRSLDVDGGAGKDAPNGRGILNLRSAVIGTPAKSLQGETKVLLESAYKGMSEAPPTSVGKGSPISESLNASSVSGSPKAALSPVVAEPHTINAEVKCDGPWGKEFPRCKDKMEWMANHWHSDKCYAENGVDGSTCSFQRYLSEVERWCPTLPNSRYTQSTASTIVEPKQLATPQLDLAPLKNQMSRNRKFNWIDRRISSQWAKWTAAYKKMVEIKPFNSTKRRILIYIGALSDRSKFKFAENADKGGPLGELVQWSDLLASVYLLGHQLELATEYDQLRNILKNARGFGSCPTKSVNVNYDVIYIDIVGLKHFKQLAKGNLANFYCMFRILDSFGTEPQFNFKGWKPDQFRSMKDKGQMWGNWNFYPRQFLTLYPHTPDNSFLGFVVGEFQRNATPSVKKNMAVVYGKEFYMWKDKKGYLDVISKYFDIHATVGSVKSPSSSDSALVPGYVTNHGILSHDKLQELLKEAKLFIGLGFPYEGPAPLEAIANGCFFLNPKLSPPVNRVNTKFFNGKPTLRSLTSQNPYAEEFISQPYVFTFDARNMQEVDRVMKAVTQSATPPGYLPYEFTHEGMLERVQAYLENQDFCYPHQWPGNDTLITKIASAGESCKDACRKEGFVCEPELFSFLNTKESISRHFSCSSAETQHSYHAPSHNPGNGHCTLQSEKLLLSCVGGAPGVTRLCPCRKFRKGQVALCVDCIR